ncbi:hypothetical protein K144312032_04580 [Clostridium tetani]|uniref:hypothetical protein n=1 Tax=Clostridium tetani TaxID=1513 RepID=UPI0024A9C33B|nr:hypothetical protein [Clostridium tetani]BDR66230.1 hypothetical protein K144312032_04580 [Clostridium tetani]
MQKTNKKGILIILFITSMAGIYSSLKINDKIIYSGTNDVASIKVSRFTDYDEFLKEKSPSIIIYNQRNEMDTSAAFIAGEVNINYDFYMKDKDYELELVRKNGESFSVGLMSKEKLPKDNIIHIPFIAYDFDHSIRGRLEKAIITIDGTEISNLKLN